jgi:hypothetical protein
MLPSLLRPFGLTRLEGSMLPPWRLALWTYNVSVSLSIDLLGVCFLLFGCPDFLEICILMLILFVPFLKQTFYADLARTSFMACSRRSFSSWVRTATR